MGRSLSICVFAASSNHVAEEFLRDAEVLGELLAKRGHAVIYGGGGVGLMGALARAVDSAGGRLVGVIPECLRTLEHAYEGADELIVTPSIRERKQTMEQRSDAFIALPGGMGTLEEVAETLVQKQIGVHNKPLILVNTRGIYNPFLDLLDHLVRTGFVPRHVPSLLSVVSTPEDAVTRVEQETAAVA
jgi:uncharacterized protein (TIGR00730 family)